MGSKFFRGISRLKQGGLKLSKLHKSFEKFDKKAIKSKKACFYEWIKNYIAITKFRGGGVFEV